MISPLSAGDGVARHPILFLVVEDRKLTTIAANSTAKPAHALGEATAGPRPTCASPNASSARSLTLHVRCRATEFVGTALQMAFPEAVEHPFCRRFQIGERAVDPVENVMCRSAADDLRLMRV